MSTRAFLFLLVCSLATPTAAADFSLSPSSPKHGSVWNPVPVADIPAGISRAKRKTPKYLDDCDGGTGTCGGGSCESYERVCYHRDVSDTCVDDSGCPH